MTHFLRGRITSWASVSFPFQQTLKVTVSKNVPEYKLFQARQLMICKSTFIVSHSAVSSATLKTQTVYNLCEDCGFGTVEWLWKDIPRVDLWKEVDFTNSLWLGVQCWCLCLWLSHLLVKMTNVAGSRSYHSPLIDVNSSSNLTAGQSIWLLSALCTLCKLLSALSQRSFVKEKHSLHFLHTSTYIHLSFCVSFILFHIWIWDFEAYET